MKKQVLILLAALSILLLGYGGVASLSRRFDETQIESKQISIEGSQKEATLKEVVSNPALENDTEHSECLLNETIEEKVGEDHQIYSEINGEIRLGDVTFITSIESGLEEAKNVRKPVFVYFWSDSCGWCKKFEDEVLTDQRVVSVLENFYVSVAVEINRQKDTTSDYKVRGTPTLVFLVAGTNEIKRVPGYTDAKTFVTILNKIRSD